MSGPDRTRRALLVLGSFGAASSFFGVEAAAARARRVPLFSIRRSTNDNEVRYDARLDDRGGFEANDPLDVYWRMRAEDGRREELNAVERNLAYGYVVRERNERALIVALRAFEERPLRLVVREGKARALVPIRGREAELERLFVQTKEGGLLPSVDYVDLHGRLTAGGRPVTERLRR